MRSRSKTIFFYLFIGVIEFNLCAQPRYFLQIEGLEESINGLDLPTDSASIIDALNHHVDALRTRGYFLANVDNLDIEKDTFKANVYKGPLFENMEIRGHNLSRDMLKLRAGKLIKGRYLSWSLVERMRNELVGYHNDLGYPFALVKFDSLEVSGQSVRANLIVDPGPLIRFDSIVVDQSIVKYNYLSRYFDIQYDAPFSQSKVDRVDKLVQQLPFVQMVGQPELSFHLGRSTIEIPLEKRKVSQFDGILGIQPGDNAESSRLTGEINLKLRNLFKSGKSLDFSWIKIQARSQQLRAQYQHPLIFNSPINIALGYDQLKQDTLFSNRSLNAQLSYSIAPYFNVGLEYENKNGNNLDGVRTENGDFDIDYYGLSLDWNRLDDRIFPTRGHTSKLSLAVGAKNLNEPGNGMANAGSDLSTQYKISYKGGTYKGLGKNKVLYLGLQMGWLQNDDVLFLNDLFRLGGLYSVRGFNENIFFASKFALTNIELRFLLEQRSYFFVFMDQAALQYSINIGEFSDEPGGLGVGFKLDMGTGLFNLVYGLGRTGAQGFSFDNSKLHFGYTGNF